MYSPETIFAEKLETIISKGEVNSRMKDYHDLLLMTRKDNLLDVKVLQDRIQNAFRHRKATLKFPIIFDSEDIQFLQQLWSRHVRGLSIHKKGLNIPERISDVLDEVNNYLGKMSDQI